MTNRQQLKLYDPTEAEELEALDIFIDHYDLRQYEHDLIERYHETGCLPVTIETY
jgi:hypothetical protein